MALPSPQGAQNCFEIKSSLAAKLEALRTWRCCIACLAEHGALFESDHVSIDAVAALVNDAKLETRARRFVLVSMTSLAAIVEDEDGDDQDVQDEDEARLAALKWTFSDWSVAIDALSQACEHTAKLDALDDAARFMRALLDTFLRSAEGKLDDKARSRAIWKR